MKKVLAVLALVALAGCASPPEEGAEVQDCNFGDDNAQGCERTITYKGKPLDCIFWQGSHEEIGMTCDFVKYYYGELGI